MGEVLVIRNDEKEGAGQPGGLISLAASALTQCQLLRFEDNVYGVLCQDEVDYPLIEVVCLHSLEYMTDNGVDAQVVLKQSIERIDEYIVRSGKVMYAWLDKLEAAA